MSGKGIADLRARFENKDNDTTPPSRGRSPAGQDNVTGSGKRKVTASFISVERSGQMGSSEDQRESTGSSEEQNSMADGANGAKVVGNGSAAETTQKNGDGGILELGNKQEAVNTSGTPEAGEAGNGTMAPEEATNINAVNPDKLVMGSEEDAPSMQPSDPKDEVAVSGGAALAPHEESLGALLKGSEFEPEGKTAKTASPKKPVTKSNPSTPKKTSSPQKTTPGQPKANTSPRINGSPRSKPGTSQPGSSPPSTLKKSEDISPSKPNKEAISINESSTDPPKTPTSPTVSKSVGEPSSEKTASPKPTTQHVGKIQPRGEDTMKAKSNHKLGRPSTGAKPIQSIASKTKPTTSAATGVPKTQKVASPTTSKPRPKSPTRPVRLPGAATATTAASAAKTGSSGPTQSSSRASLSNATKPSALNKPNGTKLTSKATQPAASGLRQKAPRSSLAASTADQKPKPRMSTASTKASGGDFLARMMRPTQSSASKTHEKVEQKTPPKKRISSRPKRISDETEKSAESKSAQAEPASEQEASVQDEAAAGEHAQAVVNGESDHLDQAEDQLEVSPEEIKGPSAEQAPASVSNA
ncbi:MAG: hypothetical protein Q9177_005858 [Variospora cf. flavescens]